MQRLNESIRSVRAYFDTLLEDYPSLSDWPDPDAQIVQNPHFESEVLKMQEFHEETSTSLEKNELS